MLIGGVGTLPTLGASLSLVPVGGVMLGIGTIGSLTARMVGKIHRQLIIWQ